MIRSAPLPASRAPRLDAALRIVAFSIEVLVVWTCRGCGTELDKYARPVRDVCRSCGYSLVGTRGERCPECGTVSRERADDEA